MDDRKVIAHPVNFHRLIENIFKYGNDWNNLTDVERFELARVLHNPEDAVPHPVDHGYAQPTLSTSLARALSMVQRSRDEDK